MSISISMDFDKYTIKEIKEMVSQGKVTNDEVVKFYNNPWWDYEEDKEDLSEYEHMGDLCRNGKEWSKCNCC